MFIEIKRTADFELRRSGITAIHGLSKACRCHAYGVSVSF